MTEQAGNEVDSLDAARAALSRERQARAQHCAEQIMQLLQAKRCRIAWVETKVDGRIVRSGWQVTAEE